MSFVFSSRRRHTRWPRDWSSDVCSSDLLTLQILLHLLLVTGEGSQHVPLADIISFRKRHTIERWSAPPGDYRRSEERRVGKECRARCARGRKKRTRRVQFR